MVVAQLIEWSILIPEISGSNPINEKIYCTNFQQYWKDKKAKSLKNFLLQIDISGKEDGDNTNDDEKKSFNSSFEIIHDYSEYSTIQVCNENGSDLGYNHNTIILMLKLYLSAKQNLSNFLFGRWITLCFK